MIVHQNDRWALFGAKFFSKQNDRKNDRCRMIADFGLKYFNKMIVEMIAQKPWFWENFNHFMHVYTRNCIFTLKIDFQAVFMHVYTRNCEFTLENWFSSSFYACIHAKLHIYIGKLVFKLFLCMHTCEIAYLQYKIGIQAVFTHVYFQIQYIWKIKLKWSRKMIVGKWSATWEFLIMKMIIDVDNGGRRL